jgi:hypothetical protein
VNRKLPADETQPGESRGLAGAPHRDIERALQIARDAHDAKVMRDLRAKLDDMMKRPSPGARNLTRKAALTLLRAMSDGLKPATDRAIGEVEGGTLVRCHPAIELLDEFIDALSDLDRGVPHYAFKAIGGNASLSTSQRKSDDVLLMTVLILQRVHGFKHRVAAERLLARNARQQGYKRDGEPISVGLLRKLRYNSKTRKPVKL